MRNLSRSMAETGSRRGTEATGENSVNSGPLCDADSDRNAGSIGTNDLQALEDSEVLLVECGDRNAEAQTRRGDEAIGPPDSAGEEVTSN